MTAVLAGVQPPRQAKLLSQERSHVRLFLFCRNLRITHVCIFCTCAPERFDAVNLLT